MSQIDAGISILTLIPWLASVGAFVYGVWQYSDKKSQSNKEPFLKEQFQLCFRASDAAARLTSETDAKKWDEARLEFWRLYYGTLCIVESREVEKAMEDLGDRIPPPGAPVPEKLPLGGDEFRDLSINLAHAARRLILRSWKIDLGRLAGEPPEPPKRSWFHAAFAAPGAKRP
jgi:hypothetical protein